MDETGQNELVDLTGLTKKELEWMHSRSASVDVLVEMCAVVPISMNLSIEWCPSIRNILEVRPMGSIQTEKQVVKI